MNFDFDAESLAPNSSSVITLASAGAVQLPVGTTAEQPAATAGRLRWNTTLARLEFSNGTAWNGLAQQATTLAGYGITDGQPLDSDLTAVAGLTTTGLVVRTGTGTAATRTITGTAGNITVTNGDGVAGNPTLNLATAGTAGTYATVTTDAFGRVTSGVTTQTTATGGTGLTAIGTANQVLGVNAAATGLEYKTITAGANITVTHGANSVTIAATAGGSPGGVNTNVQFNNSGAFGGSNSFNFVTGTNPYVAIAGTTATNQLRVGGATDIGTSTVYIETNNTDNEGQRVYFNSGTPATSGWMSYAYDSSTPYLRITDADNDPPYVVFHTIGTGTYAAPQYTSVFAARGTYGSRTGGADAGFAWHIGANQNGNALITADAPVMELDTQWLRVPVGTTAQRPTGVNGMARFNTTTGVPELFGSANWLQQTGIIFKSVVTSSITSNATSDFMNVTIPGGTLGTNRALRIRAAGTWSTSGSGNRQATMSIIYGGTTMWADNTNNLGSGSTIGWHLDVILASNNATGSQTVNGLIFHGGTGAAATGITGDLATNGRAYAVLTGTSSVNSNAAQTLALSVAMTGGTNNWTTYFYTVELI